MSPPWPLAALLVVALSMITFAAQSKLECSCTSTHYDDVSFSVTCERNLTGSLPQQGDSMKFLEKSEVSCTQGPVPPPGSDYRHVDNLGFYKFHPVFSTWEEALRTCAREGANLAVVNSAAEANAIAAIFAEYPRLSEDSWHNFEVWVGVTDFAKEGDYRTLKGETLQEAGWEAWVKGEPNNLHGNEHCLAFTRNKELNDVPCNIKIASLCERRI